MPDSRLTSREETDEGSARVRLSIGASPPSAGADAPLPVPPFGDGEHAARTAEAASTPAPAPVARRRVRRPMCPFGSG